MSTFDPASLLETTTESANDTKIIPVPEGEYLAVIDKIAINTWQSKDGSSSGLRLDVEYMIDDEAAKAATGRDKLSVRQIRKYLRRATAIAKRIALRHESGRAENISLITRLTHSAYLAVYRIFLLFPRLRRRWHRFRRQTAAT